MADIRIAPQDLQKTVEALLDKYGDEVIEAAEEAIETTATEAVKEVKARSPKRTGKYRKGWAKKIEKGRLGSKAIVYNRTQYRITHLLEFGHVLKVGGRTKGRAPAYPHIAEVNDKMPDMFARNLEKELG